MTAKPTCVVMVTELEGLADLARTVPGAEIITAYDRDSALKRAAPRFRLFWPRQK